MVSDDEYRREQRDWLHRMLQVSGETIVQDEGDVVHTETRVIVLHRPNETLEEWRARVRAASPPLSPEQQAVIRKCAAEFWAIREREASEGTVTHPFVIDP